MIGIACLHAGDVMPRPDRCPCSIECRCRTYSSLPCNWKVRDTNRERVTGSSASIQTVGTPRWLIDSVVLTWGAITLDAAADAVNKVCHDFIGESTDATSLPYWIAPVHNLAGSSHAIVWCNPPYKTAGKFASVALASAKRGQVVVMLTLASVGSKWWASFVHRKADVYFISPRVKFIGHTAPFMKDLAILVYRPGFVEDDNAQYYCARLEAGKVQDIRLAAR